MQQDPEEKRKEADQKPQKLFTIKANLWDDGVISGQAIEIRNLGRESNQKCVVPSYDDFIACVRSILPSTIMVIEPLVKHIFKDIGIEDKDECVKIGKIIVDLYSDSVIDSDFSELVQGTRGAPKAWRMEPREFISMVESRVGQLTKPFQTLIESGPYTAPVTLDTSIPAVMMDLEQDFEPEDDDDQLDENYDLTSE